MNTQITIAIIGIIGAIFGGQGFWAWLMNRRNGKSNEAKLLMGIAYSKIIDQCNKYIFSRYNFVFNTYCAPRRHIHRMHSRPSLFSRLYYNFTLWLTDVYTNTLPLYWYSNRIHRNYTNTARFHNKLDCGAKRNGYIQQFNSWVHEGNQNQVIIPERGSAFGIICHYWRIWELVLR